MLNKMFPEKSKRFSKNFRYNNTAINGEIIAEICNGISSFKNYHNYKFEFLNVSFADSLIVPFLDLIFLHIIQTGGRISIKYSLSNDGSIYNKTFYLSAIYNSINGKNKIVRGKFLEYYYSSSEVESGTRIYFEYANTSELKRKNKEKVYPKLLADIEKMCSINGVNNVEYAKKINQMLYEIVENYFEHAKCSCVLSLSVTEGKHVENMKKYTCFTISILGLSETKIYDGMKNFYEKLEKEIDLITDNEVANKYNIFLKQYKIHRTLFDDKYNIEHFLTINSFQDGTTSRPRSFGINGGTGLANALAIFSKDLGDNDGYSYVYNGRHVCFFSVKKMNMIDKFVVFSEDGKIESPLSANIASFSPLFLPGTAFQFVFPIKKGDEKN